MHNETILIGNMASEAELRFTASGIPVAAIRLACNNPRREGVEPSAEFFDVVLWRGDAQFAANYLERGRLVFVQGYLKNREYVGSDNIKRRVTEVHALKFKALDRPKTFGVALDTEGNVGGPGVPDAGNGPGGDTDGDLETAFDAPKVDEDITDTFAG